MNNLDRLIVEKVMNWRQITIEGHKYLVDKDGEIVNGSHPEFFPTSDANDAFRVVDKMKDLGWEFNLDIENGELDIAVFSIHNLKKYHMASDPDRLVAICKAALEAMNND